MRNNLILQNRDNIIPSGVKLAGSFKGSPNGRGYRINILFTAIFLIISFQFGKVEARPKIEAPEFELVTLKGQAFSKASLRGQPTLMMFWAPWCHYCQQELPILAKFYRDNKPEQLQILTIAFADSRDNVLEYIRSNPDTFVFPTAYDDEDRIAKRFGVHATPTFVVMNAEGDLILAHQGARLHANREYQAFLKSLEK